MTNQAMIDHIKSHIKYPATKNEIWAACQEMSDVPETDRKMFNDKVPEGVYENADEVLTVLGLE
jgi:hypothetical protein